MQPDTADAIEALEEVLEFLDDQADILDSDESLRPNRAMQLATTVRCIIAQLTREAL